MKTERDTARQRLAAIDAHLNGNYVAGHSLGTPDSSDVGTGIVQSKSLSPQLASQLPYTLRRFTLSGKVVVITG
jgi:hypothetical protein